MGKPQVVLDTGGTEGRIRNVSLYTDLETEHLSQVALVSFVRSDEKNHHAGSLLSNSALSV